MQGMIYQTWGLSNLKKSLFFRKPERSAPNLCSWHYSSTLKSLLKTVAPKGSLKRTVLQPAGAALFFQRSRKFHRIYSSLAFLLKFLDRWFRQPCCVSLAQQQASMTRQVRCSIHHPDHQGCSVIICKTARQLQSLQLQISHFCELAAMLSHRWCLQASLCHF